MIKKKFVPLACITFMPAVEWDLDKAIDYAERLHERLMQRGYGINQQQPRETKDWFGEMPEQQQRWFIEFWKAYNHKHGKQRAAMQWTKINPDAALAKQIIEAASVDSLEPRSGVVRKMAEGWLSERRWEDYQQDTPSKTQAKNQERAELRMDLKHLQGLYKASPSEQLADQITALETTLETL